METSQVDALDSAFQLIEWWRSVHARPLTSLSANLRHYVKPHGDVLVAQIVRRKGRLIDVQLRTPVQDAWANQVEEDSRRVGRNFKGGEGEAEVHGYYAVVSELLALRELDEQPDDDLRHRLLHAYEAAQPFLTNDSGGKR